MPALPRDSHPVALIAGKRLIDHASGESLAHLGRPVKQPREPLPAGAIPRAGMQELTRHFSHCVSKTLRGQAWAGLAGQ
jgi:hypothetical protein